MRFVADPSEAAVGNYAALMAEPSSPAAAQAAANVAAVSDDAAARLQMAEAFYGAHGGPDFRYERAPLAFMRWEVRRGVLNPVAAGGSRWWRAVNGNFLRDAEEARLILEAAGPGDDPCSGGDRDVAGVDVGSSVAVDRWVAFGRDPTRSSWYAAHNSSVAMGYIEHATLAADESPVEQLLMDHTISRVLFAEAVEDGSRLDLGPAAEVARWLGDPRTVGVGTFVDVPDFYPDHYPLTREDDRRLNHRTRSVEELLTATMDDAVVAPLVPQLFADAAERLSLADLARFVHAGAVAYPWPLIVAADELANVPIAEHRPSAVWRALTALVHPRGTPA